MILLVIYEIGSRDDRGYLSWVRNGQCVVRRGSDKRYFLYLNRLLGKCGTRVVKILLGNESDENEAWKLAISLVALLRNGVRRKIAIY